MAHEVVLASIPRKNEIFYCLTSSSVLGFIIFLGPAKFNLTYWNELKGFGKELNHSISFQLFLTLMRLRQRGFDNLTTAH